MIPNILWQTWKTKNFPKSLKNQTDSWRISNPNLKIRVMDDAECSEFILEHFGSSVHTLYKSLPLPIMKADFWRIAVVYIHGGYYSDLDMTCNKPISKFINSNVSAVFMREINNISNYFFGATPNHPAIKLALEQMIEEMKIILNKETQSFGMHGLHSAVRSHYKVFETKYESDEEVQFLLDSEMRDTKTLIHSMASLAPSNDYESWRARVSIMNKERSECEDILFFTTFNKNGYDLYGREWIKSFVVVANYYNKYRAKIYYEGFKPDFEHPSIEWVNYKTAIPHHPKWKQEYTSKTNHQEYVKTMTVRFSHKAFVIMHALEHNTNDYLIWLDGDCIFKNADYTYFPSKIMKNKSVACQVEHAAELNHVESGILIFDGKHEDKQVFLNAFRKWYEVDNIIPMGQPYDGFLVFKTLLTTGIKYADLNKDIGGGIQSDPNMTFLHPEIKSKFVHNIGWTGKNQYDNWKEVYERDDIYKKMKSALFNLGSDPELNNKKESAMNKLKRMKNSNIRK